MLNSLASAKKKENTQLFTNTKNKKKRELDRLFHEAHEEVFETLDCLSCANCCKTLGPRITDKDIERMSKALRLKPIELFETYLNIDEDGDTVFKTMPCPFLLPDNYCMIYEARPKACREYPHTDRSNIFQLKNITIKNSFTCPAVYDILEIVKQSTT